MEGSISSGLSALKMPFVVDLKNVPDLVTPKWKRHIVLSVRISVERASAGLIKATSAFAGRSQLRAASSAKYTLQSVAGNANLRP